MKRLGIVFVGVLFFWTIGFGQDGNFPESKPGTGTVVGKALDGDAKEELAYANVLLYRQGSKQPLSQTANQSGNFIFRDVEYGGYTLVISFLAMETYVSSPFMIDKGHRVIQLGTLSLKTNLNTIKEIQVNGEKVTEEIDLEKKVFNVAQEINNTGGSVLDAMRNIPALNVGIDGDVQLRGSNNVKILVNGRPSSLIGTGGELKLEQLPAASIEAIEVITNPSAKYGAAGKTGIVNIILKKTSDHGFNYSVSFLAGTKNKVSSGLNMNYRTGHWNWRMGYQFDQKEYVYNHILDQQRIFPDTINYLEETSTADKVKTGNAGSFGVDWNPSRTMEFYTTVTLNPHVGQKSSVYNYAFFDESHEYDNNSVRKTQDDEAMMGLSAELGLNKKFSRKGMSWNTVYSYDYGTKEDSVQSIQSYFENQNLLSESYEKNRRDQNVTTQRFQSDFVYPFSEVLKVETGMMYSMRYLDNDFRYFSKSGGVWVPNLSRTNDFIYDEKIGAGYLMGTMEVAKWTFNAGVRVENTDVISKLQNATQQFPNNYTNFFPSGHIGWDIFPKGKGTMMISYSRRIKRPSYRKLNPFVSFNDNENIRRGNPLLKPELTDSWEIGWQSRWKKGSINPAIFYRYTDDKIGYYTHLLANGIRELTFVNLNSSTSQGAELNGSYYPIKWFRLSGNISYFYIEKDGENLDNKITNEGDMWMARLMASFKLTSGLSIQVSNFYNSGFVGVLGKSEPMKDVDFGMTYRTFKNRGKFILKVSDVFATRRFAMHIDSKDLIMDFEKKRDYRVLWLGFNWELKQSKGKSHGKKKHKSGGDLDI